MEEIIKSYTFVGQNINNHFEEKKKKRKTELLILKKNKSGVLSINDRIRLFVIIHHIKG